MSSISDVGLGGFSYYDPKQENKKVRFVKGQYLVNVVKVEITKGKMIKEYCADIYNITLRVAKGNEVNNYAKDGDTISGKEFIGQEIKSSGVFHFLSPSVTDSFKGNHGGNNKYYNLLKSCGVECETKELEVNGEMREVYVLPNATDEDLTFEFTIYDPYANANTSVLGFVGQKYGDGVKYWGAFNAIQTDTNVVTHIKFYFASGNVSAGNFKLYRRANA